MVDLVYVVHVVEAIRCGGIQVERRATALRRTRRPKVRRHGLGHVRLLHWVNAGRHRVAVGVTDGVRTCAFSVHK